MKKILEKQWLNDNLNLKKVEFKNFYKKPTIPL